MSLLRTLSIVFAAAAVSQAMGDHTVFDTTSPPPPRNPRVAAPFVVGLELGGNSLASILGGRATWYPFQQLALDAGGSWSNAGLRGGFGVRWFTSSAFSSPFVGLAWKRASGVDSASLDDGNSSQSTVNINPIQYMVVPRVVAISIGLPMLVIFAILVMGTIIIVASISSLLYHWGILQKVVHAFAWVMRICAGSVVGFPSMVSYMLPELSMRSMNVIPFAAPASAVNPVISRAGP